MSYSRGDVVLVLFPNSDLQRTRKRPALIVQNDALSLDHPQRVVACITSRLHRTGLTRLPIAVESDAGRTMGLIRDSLVIVDNLATVADDTIDRRLGSCPIMHEIDARLRLVLGLPAMSDAEMDQPSRS